MTRLTSPVRTRLVLNFYGFESGDSQKLLGRFLYCAEKTARLWHFQIKHSPPEHQEHHDCSHSLITTTGSDWRVETKIVQFSCGDIVQAYQSGFFPFNLCKNIFHYLTVLLSFMPLRYFLASKLYGLFMLYPLVLMGNFSVLSFLLAQGVVSFAGSMGWAVPPWGEMMLILGFFVALCRWPGQKCYLLLSLAHWSFARDVAFQTNPVIQDRYKILADQLIKEIEGSDYDEIILSGHSFGSSWATIAMARAILINPDLCVGKHISFLRLGSSLMNTALFPKAQFIREYIALLASKAEIFWHEFQTKDDVVSFYKADFITHLNLPQPKGGHQISRVNFKHSMDLKRYRKMKWSFYEVHRQYGLYQDKCVSFDYMIRNLGPLSSKDIAHDPQILRVITPDFQP